MCNYLVGWTSGYTSLSTNWLRATLEAGSRLGGPGVSQGHGAKGADLRHPLIVVAFHVL
jgi:hypothetical protein